MDIKEIMSLLPHRYPFLLVDRIVERGEDSIAGIKNVTINEPFFEGHFPGNPIMPGVLIVEAMAQVAGVLALGASEAGEKSVFFMSIEKAKFRKPVVPGDQLRLQAKVVHRRNNVWRFQAAATVEGTVVAETEFTAMLTDRCRQ